MGYEKKKPYYLWLGGGMGWHCKQVKMYLNSTLKRARLTLISALVRLSVAVSQDGLIEIYICTWHRCHGWPPEQRGSWPRGGVLRCHVMGEGARPLSWLLVDCSLCRRSSNFLFFLEEHVWRRQKVGLRIRGGSRQQKSNQLWSAKMLDRT